MPTATIDAVLSRLDEIGERARREGSRVGYFAATYRDVTARVKHDIAVGRFEDGPRMERLDVIFAKRYLNALDDHRAQRRRAVAGEWHSTRPQAGLPWFSSTSSLA